MSQETFVQDLELALLRGLNLRVTNQGRIEPETETMRTKAGLSGALGTVRVFDVAERTADPRLNPLWEQTRRESYRLGNMLVDTRLQASVLPGRE